MKKLLLFFWLAGALSYGVEIGGELKSTYFIYDDGKSEIENKVKIDFKEKGDKFYSQLTVKGVYKNQGELEIDRAFTELYAGDLTLTVGKGRILWGAPYLFNFSDVFNTINLKDPKGEKEGINFISLKYGLGDTGRIEAVGVINREKKVDFGGRITLNAGNSEIMAAYVKNLPKAVNDRLQLLNMVNSKISSQYYILEIKGEAELGLWGEAVYRLNSKENISEIIGKEIPEREKIAVAGADYTLSILEKSLYILGEGAYNYDKRELLFYGICRLSISEDAKISQSIIGDGNKKGYLMSTTGEYTINEYITAAVTYNKYINSEKSSFLSPDGKALGNEGCFSLKANF